MDTEIKIIPAILSRRIETYILKIKLMSNFFDQIHIDIAEKSYTKHFNTPKFESIFNEIMKRRDLIEHNKYNVHLMTINQIDQAQAIFSKYQELINFIYIDINLLNQNKEFVHKFQNKIVANIKTEQRIKNFIDILQICKNIQVMSVNIGKQGQKFNTKALAKIKYISNKYPDKQIHVDGGINSKSAVFLKNYPQIRIVNVGSFFSKTNKLQSIKTRKNLLEKILLNKNTF